MIELFVWLVIGAFIYLLGFVIGNKHGRAEYRTQFLWDSERGWHRVKKPKAIVAPVQLSRSRSEADDVLNAEVIE